MAPRTFGEDPVRRSVVRAGLVAAALACAAVGSTQSLPRVHRLDGNPIIRPEMLPGEEGGNINGPSLIRVPEWVANPLGRYYLYFAHHRGRHIRLAYADSLEGPWRVHAPGTLPIEDTVCNEVADSPRPEYRHIASPDAHVDEAAREIRLYFHCPAWISGPRDDRDSYKQVTLVATSPDGLHFEPGREPLGNSYFRVFRWEGAWYGLGMPGILYRSTDGLTGFEEGPTLFTEDMRHSAVTVRDGVLFVFHTVVGHNPESILLSTIDLAPDWSRWRESEPKLVLAPERPWEGGDLPAEPSERGAINERVRQLRDPALFEENGRSYLLYSVAGESGIAIAELLW